MTVITICFVCAPNPLLTKFTFLSVLSVDSHTLSHREKLFGTDYTDSVPGCKPVHPLRAADKAVCSSVSHKAECNNINISLSPLHGLGQVG